MLATAIAITVAAMVGFWVVGGLLLRRGGLIVAFLGILTLAITGNLAGLIVLAVGLVLWLVGHWHYALRHHDYKAHSRNGSSNCCYQVGSTPPRGGSPRSPRCPCAANADCGADSCGPTAPG